MPPLRTLARTTVLSLLSCWPLTTSAAEAAKPNILILLADDSGYNEFSMQGAKEFSTPRIDSIAANGVRFTDGYVSGSVCSPTRAGLLTGRYQQHFGHEFNIPPAYSDSNGLPLTETLLPAALKEGGYRTIALGKWHLGYAPKFHPMARGFTDFHGFLQGARSYFPLDNPGRLNQLLNDREPVARENFTYMTDHLAEKATEYIIATNDRPFFMYVAFNATHSPNHAIPEDLAAAGGNRIKAMTIALDRAVGRILDSLKRTDKLDNTLVFFLVDNGGATGHNNAPLHGHKGSTWEGGIRVPFAVQWPGKIPAGKTSHQAVIALDIFPTVLAAAGIAKSSGKPLHGVNLLPLLTGKSPTLAPRPLFWKSGSNWAVRDGDLKLVGGNKERVVQAPLLFDLAKDTSETHNLAGTRPEDVKRLTKLYQDWARQVQPTAWGKGNVAAGDAESDSTAAGKAANINPNNKRRNKAKP